MCLNSLFFYIIHINSNNIKLKIIQAQVTFRLSSLQKLLLMFTQTLHLIFMDTKALRKDLVSQAFNINSKRWLKIKAPTKSSRVTIKKRYFVTKFLKNTHSNIVLTSEYVGHSTWDMVKRYVKSMIDDNVQTNLNIL